VDERLIGGAVGEGIDDVCICDVGELIALLGEVLDVFALSLVEVIVRALTLIASQ
jgi:hypothetical protein